MRLCCCNTKPMESCKTNETGRRESPADAGGVILPLGQFELALPGNVLRACLALPSKARLVMIEAPRNEKRDEVLKRMLNTPPKPHDADKHKQPKPAPKDRKPPKDAPKPTN